MNTENNRATAAGTTGAALATLIVMFGPQYGIIEIPDATFAAAATGALTVVFTAASRWLKKRE